MKRSIGIQSHKIIQTGNLRLRHDGTFAYRPQIKVTKANKLYRAYKSFIYFFVAPLP